MAKALAQNTTLEECSFPTKACLGIQKEKQIVMHQLAVGIAKHPTLSEMHKRKFSRHFFAKKNSAKISLQAPCTATALQQMQQA